MLRSLSACVLLLAACAGGSEPGEDSAKEDTGADTDDVGFPERTAVCAEATAIACEDTMFQELSLHDDKVNKGDVTTELQGSDFITLVDATSGGSSRSTQNAWVYVRFTQGGAEKLDIDDDTALTDLTWHLALRRYVLRLNGGDGGPSCVGVSPQPRKEYADLDAGDIDGASFELEDFYSDTCVLQTDQIGTAATAMSDWWNYASCVETTGTPFLVQLEDGHVLKLAVETYYEGEGQAECNEEGSTDAESGWITLRWAYLY
jgi:hypothetical protein